MLSQKNIFRLSFIALFALVVLTYLNHFHNSFHFDDSHTIQNNIFIRDIKNIPKFFTDATTFSSNPSNQSYRPVVSASLAVDYWLSKDGDTFFFHLRNFVAFLIYTLLVYFFVLKIFNSTNVFSENKFPALFVAAIFSLHPIVAETVNYIIARSDIISSVGVMAGMVIWLYFPQKRKFGIYLLPVIVGMLAKPSAAMFAPILIFTDWLLREKKSPVASSANRLIISSLNTLPAFIVCGMLYLFIDHMTPKTWVPGGVSRSDYLITQPYIILLYVRNFFFPFYLSADTDLSPFASASELRAIIGFLFLAFLIAVIIFSSQKKKYFPVVLGLFWFLAALIPTSSIVPLAEVMNDHRMFFPLPGLVMAIGWLLLIAYSRMKIFSGKLFRTVSIIFLLCILFAFHYGTHERNKVWHTEESLWKDVTEKSPRNGRGLMNYGLTLMAKGNIAEALDYFERAKQFTPSYPVLFVNIAIAKNALGNSFEAENNFKIALSLASDNPECNFYYARFLSQRKRNTEAINYLNRTLALSPAHLDAKIFLEQLQTEENLPDRQAGKSPPSPTAEYFLNLSLQFYNEKKFTECIDACHHALQLKPNYAEAYNNICSAYNELKEYALAMQACDSALKLSPAFTLAKNNLEYAKKMLGKKN